MLNCSGVCGKKWEGKTSQIMTAALKNVVDRQLKDKAQALGKLIRNES